MVVTPDEFWPVALPCAQEAHAATGVLTSVILSQWADETAYGGPNWTVYCNPGDIGDPDEGGQTTFPTLAAGVAAYIALMNDPLYAAVRQAVGWQAQCVALGESPWAASHYDESGGGPGSDLVSIIEDNDLTRYDQPVPAPTPEGGIVASAMQTSPASELPVIVQVTASGALWLWWQMPGGQWPGPLGLDGGLSTDSSVALGFSGSGAAALISVMVEEPGSPPRYYWQTANGQFHGPLGMAS